MRACLIHASQNRSLQPITQRGNALRNAFVEAHASDLRSLAQANDARNIFRSGTTLALMRPPVKKWVDLGIFANK